MFEEAEKKFGNGKYGDVVVMPKDKLKVLLKFAKTLICMTLTMILAY